MIRISYIFCLGMLSLCSLRADTIVRFDTVLGTFDVQLYDRVGPTVTTPLTAANFLTYVQSEAYVNSFFHRSVPGFVLQGGGFTIEGNSISEVTANSPVTNEPGNTNVRGTLAMAKLGGDPDSATNQWFFNLGDNSANLDDQNGGFTVFGHVVGDGMDVVDALAAITAYDASGILGSTFSELPLLNPVLDPGNLLMVNSVVEVPLAITELSVTESGIVLTWDGAGDTSVDVQRATDLETEDWQTLVSSQTGTTYTDPEPPETGPVYYRVKKP